MVFGHVHTMPYNRTANLQRCLCVKKAKHTKTNKYACSFSVVDVPYG